MKAQFFRSLVTFASGLILTVWDATPGYSQEEGSPAKGRVDGAQRASTNQAPVPVYPPYFPEALWGNEIPAQRGRIDELVATIRSETWEQSFENMLTNGNQSATVAANTIGAQVQLEEMLSVRRAVRILNTLQTFESVDRLEKCGKLFDRALRVCEEVEIAAQWTKTEAELSAAGKLRLYPRHALCLAMFATAETGRRDILGKQFKQLDDFQKRMEAHWDETGTVPVGSGGNSQMIRKFLREFRLPDNRFQINVLRLAAARDPHSPTNLVQRIDDYCGSRNMKLWEVDIVPWDARTTLFDYRVGSPPDTSKGVTKYLFHNWESDMLIGKHEAQVEVVQTIRKLAL